MAYRIALYENSGFSTFVGGPIRTLAEAQEQISTLAKSINADAATSNGITGYKFNRAGTPCALIVTNALGFPVQDIDFTEVNN